MDIPKNVRLTRLGREHMVTMVLSGQTPKAIGEAVGVCPRHGPQMGRTLPDGRLGQPAGPQLPPRQAAPVNATGHNNRGIGQEFVHIDDASRIAFSRVVKSERKACVITFLEAAVAYYASLGTTVERVMTDNGSCYEAFTFRGACKRLGRRHGGLWIGD